MSVCSTAVCSFSTGEADEMVTALAGDASARGVGAADNSGSGVTALPTETKLATSLRISVDSKTGSGASSISVAVLPIITGKAELVPAEATMRGPLAGLGSLDAS